MIAYSHGLEIGLVGYLVSAMFLSRHDLELIDEIFALAAGFRLIARGYEREAEARARLEEIENVLASTDAALSDAQEQLAHADAEGARQTLNRAKAVLFRVMDGELRGGEEK